MSDHGHKWRKFSVVRSPDRSMAFLFCDLDFFFIGAGRRGGQHVGGHNTDFVKNFTANVWESNARIDCRPQVALGWFLQPYWQFR